VHNNITHQSGPVGILNSVHTLLAMDSGLDEVETKDSHGKSSVSALTKGKEAITNSKSSGWSPPPLGWTKLNVDGSFLLETEATGIGVVARDSSGRVLFTAWRTLLRCADAAEAEARACIEGLSLASRLC
jgi:hypothetical protein